MNYVVVSKMNFFGEKAIVCAKMLVIKQKIVGKECLC